MVYYLEIGAPVRSNLLFDLYKAFYQIEWSQIGFISFMHAQHIPSYNLILGTMNIFSLPSKILYNKTNLFQIKFEAPETRHELVFTNTPLALCPILEQMRSFQKSAYTAVQI